MGEQEELAAWAAARWPTLVRVALGLGAPADVAAQVAADALARIRPRWRGLRSQGDPDADVLALLLEAWYDACAQCWWERHPLAPVPDPDPMAPLDALGRRERAALVIARLGDVGDAPPPGAGSGPEPEPVPWQTLRTVPVLVPAPTSAQLDVLARRRRARRTRRWAGATVAAALVLGLAAGAGWAVSRPAPPDTSEPRALAGVEVVGTDTSVRSAWLTWWADGRLHLGAAVLRVPDLRQVVDVTGGAVYVDGADRVVRITPTGARTLLGRTTGTLAAVASDDGDLVGWVDVRGGRHLVVADATDSTDGRDRRTLDLPGGTGHADDELVALDSARAYLTGAAGSWSRPLAGGAAGASEPATLLAVAGDLAVYAPTADSGEVRAARLDPTGELPSPALAVGIAGDEAALSPDAGYVLTRTAAGAVVIHDLSSGRDLATGVRGDEVALAATLGSQGRVAYVVARAADRPQADDFVRSSFTGPAILRTCVFARDLVTTACEDVERVSGTSGTPVLAR